MRPLTTGRTLFRLLAIAIVLLTASVVDRVRAQDGGILVAGGLNGPMGVLVTPDGTLWVVDSGTGGDEVREGIDPATRQPSTIRSGETSRILRIRSDGTQEVLALLPSVMTNPTLVFGGARLSMLGGELYVTSGGWSEVNPGEREPLHAAVVRIADGERTEVANTWNVERDRNPDGTSLETNPYGLTVGPDSMLWVADAAANTLLKVDPTTGALDVVAVFGGLESPLPNANRGGALESDPVPTAVAFDRQGNAYVSLLPGTPFRPGSARVLKVTPDGAVQEWANNLTMLTDLRRGPDGDLYAVSYGRFTEQGPVPNSGAIVRVHPGNASEEVVTGLSFPTSVDFDAAGNAFVTTNGGGPPGAGELWKFDAVASPPASAPPPEPLRYTRVYTDSTGTSHFADAELVLAAVDIPGASRAMGARPLDGAGKGTFFCFEPGTTVDWHPAPRRQFYLILSGGLDLEVSDGDVRSFGSGDILLGEATEGLGVRARWSDAGRSCGVLLPHSAPALPASALLSPSGARDRDTGPTPELQEMDIGTLQPSGRPLARTIQASSEAGCVVDLTQGYLLTGPLAGTAQIEYRILVQGTCDDPPGTYDEAWIAVGTFDGTLDGSEASGTFQYVARVHAGGDVEGRMSLGDGLRGELLVRGNFGDGKLRYEFVSR